MDTIDSKLAALTQERDALQVQADRLERELEEARTEAAELQSSLDLQIDCNYRARQMYADETGITDAWPDGAALQCWLMKRIDELLWKACPEGDDGLVNDPPGHFHCEMKQQLLQLGGRFEMKQKECVHMESIIKSGDWKKQAREFGDMGGCPCCFAEDGHQGNCYIAELESECDERRGDLARAFKRGGKQKP